MAIEIKDYISASLVLVGGKLLSTDHEAQSFGNAVDSEIVLATPFGGQESLPHPVPIRQLKINRDRISIDVTSTSSSIKQEFPSGDLSALAHISAMAIDHTTTPSDVTAHGYNVELVYDQTSSRSSFSYIADRILGDFPSPLGWTVVGGSSQLRFHDRDERVWHVVLEPRFKADDTTKVFFSLNLHVVGAPKSSDIRSSLQLTMDMASLFVRTLDG